MRLNDIDSSPTFDQEELPIVKALRDQVENMSEFLCYATNGKLSKSDHNLDEMKIALEDTLTEQCEACEEVRALREKLARYERAEKDGRLIVSPIAIGQTVYHAVFYKDGRLANLNESVVVGLHLRDEERFRGIKGKEYLVVRSNGYSRHLDFDEIGKTVFLTREEFEAALKEMTKHET